MKWPLGQTRKYFDMKTEHEFWMDLIPCLLGVPSSMCRRKTLGKTTLKQGVTYFC